ncbi:MAG: cupin domain-containing protein [Gammaproteobacteria bacterium]
MQQASVSAPDSCGEYLTEERCYILELSNDEGDPAASIARARVLPGTTTKLHRVMHTAERYVLLQGQGEVSIDREPSQSVGPGSVVRIPPGVPQRISNTGHDDLIFLCICTPRFEWSNYESLE